MQTFTNNNATFIHLDDIKKSKVNEAYFIGCKSARKCVERHSIPDDKCLYVKNGKMYNKGYKTAEVFVESEYANENILNKNEYIKKRDAMVEQQKMDRIDNNTMERNARKEYADDEVIEAPPLVHLDDNQMFKDANGDPMDIEMRGEKTMEGAYFKAYDVGKAFNVNDINTILTHTTSDHVYGQHYSYFKHIGVDQNSNKELYLTYMGVLKLLFCSRGNKAERFQKWETKILFTMQMGNQDDKDALAAEALNVDQSTITQLFRKSARAVPCVYLFEVGTVGNMRKHFNLEGYTNDEDKVYKYGMTSDMARRANEHSKTYGKLKDNSFGLTVFSYIDATFMSKAETKLKHSFDSMSIRLDDPKHNELVVIKNEQLAFTKVLYNDMYIYYSGNNADLIRQMQEMQMLHQMEIREKDHAIEVLNLHHKTELQAVELNYLRKMVK
jgi:hypothetical protein